MNACPVVGCRGRLTDPDDPQQFVLQCDHCKLGAGSPGNGHTKDDVLRKVRARSEHHAENCAAGPADLSWTNRGPLGLAQGPDGTALPPVLGGPTGATSLPPDVIAGVQPLAALLPEFLWLDCAICKDTELVA